MGMFDNIHINEIFIPKIQELIDNDYKIKVLQTKSLDCLLEDYYIDENGKFFVDKVEYDVIVNMESEKKFKWPPFYTEEKNRERKFVSHTGLIDAYEYFSKNDINGYPEKNSVSVKLTFKLIDGIVKDTKISEIKVYKKEELLNQKLEREKFCALRESDPFYHISRYLFRCLNRIINFLNKIQNKLINYKIK